MPRPRWQGRVRVNNASCLDRCDEGPTMVIYGRVWYHYENEPSTEHQRTYLQNGRVVQTAADMDLESPPGAACRDLSSSPQPTSQ